MAYTTRLTGLVAYDPNPHHYRVLHVGGAFSQRHPKDDVVTFNQGPRNTLLQFFDDPLIPFMPNVQIPASQNQLYNIEWAAALGSLWLQAEWSGTHIDQIGGGPVLLSGAYIFATYLLTGEHHEYLPKRGTFDGVKVRSPFFCHRRKCCRKGPGAWELTLRFAYLDFDNPNIPLSDQGLRVGNKLSELTAGMNWYLNDNTRFMFNYIHAVPVDPNFGPSYADAFFLRTAIFW
jgi:phosphate-selective porin OprO/OprP